MSKNQDEMRRRRRKYRLAVQKSKRGRRPKGSGSDGVEPPSIDRRQSDGTISHNSTPEATHQQPVAPTTAPPQPPQPMYVPYTPVGRSETAGPSNLTEIGYFPRIADLGNISNTNNPDVLSQATRGSERAANPLATFTRERPLELPILPLMEMVDGNESRQILESRVRLAEQLTGTYITPSEPYMDNVPTPAASTTFTNNPSSSDIHHQDRRARLQSLPHTVLNPLGLLAEASLRGSDEAPSEVPTPRHSPPLSGTNLAGNYEYNTLGTRYLRARTNRQLPGVGNAKYFELKPKILKLLSWQQVQELFDLYFANMHKFLPVLHRDLHTPIMVLARSEFLLTTYVPVPVRALPDLALNWYWN
ncbi:hypothetical protein QFC21_004516 [Naganishia friedmannii]|uniref:Uncharacterized protein n=1 Tax=Naganishia friedmannii TaxID=89922 RepID=A0ACC2VGX8_9TREE|nr:hypothetical protein QFC21_004516 [Naganishia friedmannii]